MPYAIQQEWQRKRMLDSDRVESFVLLDDLDPFIFIVVSLLNIGNVPSLELAEINYRATVRAAEMSAFTSAERYAEQGIKNLLEDHWEYSELALELYSLAAEDTGGLGNIEKMEG
jgi:predicted ATPase